MTAADPREVLADALESAASRGLSLRPGTAVLNDAGWDFRVVEVEDTEGADWILRVPRRSRSADRIAVEAAVLAVVRPALPVAVPTGSTPTARSSRTADSAAPPPDSRTRPACATSGTPRRAAVGPAPRT